MAFITITCIAIFAIPFMFWSLFNHRKENHIFGLSKWSVLIVLIIICTALAVGVSLLGIYYLL